MFRSLVVKLLAIIIAAPFLLYFVWKFQLIDLLLLPSDVKTWQLTTSSWAIAFSPNGEMLATISGKLIRRQLANNFSEQGHPHVEIRRVFDGSIIRTIDFFAAKSLAFSPDNTLLAAGGYGGEINIWRISDGQKLHSLVASDEPWSRTLVLAFAPDGQSLVSLAVYPTVAETKFNQLSVWNVASGEQRYSFTGRYTCAAISPDGQLLALSGRKEPLTLYRLGDGIQVRQLQSRPDLCFYLNFSPDGKLLAYLSRGINEGIPVYNVADGQLVHLLSPRIEFFNNFENLINIAISPDGRYLAAAYNVKSTSEFIGPSIDYASHGRIRMWRLDNGRRMPTLRGHKSGVYRLAFHPKGRLLASAGHDATIRFWRVPPQNFTWLWSLLNLIILGYYLRLYLLQWQQQ